MSSLRERLRAVSSAKPQSTSPAVPVQDFFCREHLFPLSELGGIERTTLEEVRFCDPLFEGQNWDVFKLLFLDTETTGLSGGAGTLAFEIGIGWIEPRGMVIRQYVMRSYAQEAAMLAEISQTIRRFDTIVSFNGKAFDLPLLESRMILNRIRLPLTQYPHLDLLHAARRVYKLRLKRCNLAALEEAVLGKGRCDDLPGAQVPQRFFDYLKTGDFSLLEAVLRHNLEDVKNLAVLTGHLCAVYRHPEQLEHAEDLFSAGRTLLRGGHTQRARGCMKILGKSTLSSQAHMVLSGSYKKEREWQEAVTTWQEMIARAEGGAWPYIELAKYYEHIAREPDRALKAAKGALVHILNTSPLGGVEDGQLAAIHRRIERLQRKNSKILNASIREDKQS